MTSLQQADRLSSPRSWPVPAALVALLYAQKPGTGDLLYVPRLGFRSSMAASLILGFTAIRRRAADFIELLDQVLQAFPLAPVIAMVSSPSQADQWSSRWPLTRNS